MINLKANRLLRLAEKLQKEDPKTAMQLKSLAEGMIIRESKPKKIKVSGVFTKAVKYIEDTLKIPHALVGGLAVRHWVTNRFTEDIDFAVLTDDVRQLKKIFPNGKQGALVYTVEVEGVDVDFLLASDWDWTKEAIENSVRSSLTGTSLNIMTPEYLILYKLEASRESDIVDLLKLLRYKDTAKKAKNLVAKYLPESMEDFDQLVEEARLGL